MRGDFGYSRITIVLFFLWITLILREFLNKDYHSHLLSDYRANDPHHEEVLLKLVSSFIKNLSLSLSQSI